MTGLVSQAGSMPPVISNIPISFSGHLWTRHLASTAGYTLIVYDYFLTLSQEIEYIWGAKWTPAKVLYLINRYVLIGTQTFILMEHTGMFYRSHRTQVDFLQFCWEYTLVGILSNYFTMETVHLSVLLRAWTVWGFHRGSFLLLRYERICPYPTRLRRHLKISAILFHIVCTFGNVFYMFTW
ncbi:hypothetical protein CONPUDRAFT_77414 [Coniophora puteana RWD-64-598 SS2]|uniref:DUF6533 domain-containing protein n=1 Tax=Coniophora puteana (strain RWD-64-598) TaxID=741705 RepID=A0A5M3M914_CONPW|nr:uncharacterized protein CONPUDRAFT_77414 [Coniophora puteana RWD-64-598 SS2]EIW75131.1 hypothetical protein CONPUDRAFT_77414 [Coniophora puteana RWD-64-598 SS2]